MPIMKQISRAVCPLSFFLLVSRRSFSQVQSSATGAKYSSWEMKNDATKLKTSSSLHSEKRAMKPVSSYPNPWTSFPLAHPKFRKTHVEWLLHHGHGERLGKYGPSRDLPDFEYADGTPASISPRRFAFKHHLDHLLVQLIRAGATVEQYEARQLLPRVPGVKEQRDWDPEIPLFLDDLDAQGNTSGLFRSSSAAGSATVHPGGFTEALVEKRFDHRENTTTPINVSKPFPHRNWNRARGHLDEEGDTGPSPLEVNTMFATYDPKAFVKDEIPTVDLRRPFWSRRRWSLSDSFMLPVSPKPKNTIKDE